MPRVTDEFDDQLPPGVEAGLRGAFIGPVGVPAAVDRAVLGAMREKFARRRRMKLFVRWGAGVAGAVAACLVVALGMGWIGRGQPAPTVVMAAVKGDLNGDGRVDMTDALLLARRVERGAGLDAKWDLSGDGRVDQADVEAIARAAVSLGGEKSVHRRDAEGAEGAQRRELAGRLPGFEELGVGRGGFGLRLGRDRSPVALGGSDLERGLLRRGETDRVPAEKEMGR